MRALFWVTVFLVFYTYVGYPLTLLALVRRRARDVARSDITPTVSIIIAARNEADKIRQKIEHTLALAYPRGRLEVLVASDDSDDATDGIVQEYAERGVRLVRAPERRGKEYVQSLAIQVAMGEVLVFTDAATVLEPDALRRLVRNFADPSIGAVSTEDTVLDASGQPTAEGLYVRYEMWVRRLEGRFHSIVGLSGSCFAIRRELCSRWPSTLASDFMGALHAARAGYRAVADPSVRGRFVTVSSPQAEMRRKIRTFLRGITVLVANLDLLNPFRHGRFAFQLASHKLLRFLAPFLLLGALAASLLSGDALLRTLFWLQAGFYLLGCASGLVRPLQRHQLARVAHYFTMAQIAMLTAWIKYAMGQQQVIWEPSKRQGILPAPPPAPAVTDPPTGTHESLTVCHIFSGDLWAGAEVVIFNLLSSLGADPSLRVIALSLNEGTLTERLRAAGITTHVIPENRHALPGILLRAARLLRDHEVTIVHAHRYKENVLAWLLAKWLDIGVLVTTMHGLPEAPTSSARHARAARVRTALDFFVLRNLFSATVAVSDEMKRALVGRYGFHPDQVPVIRNGGRFPPASVSAAPRDECFHIGTVGRLVPIKGLDLFLDVAGALKRQGRPVRFSILGDGPMREDLGRRAADLKIEDCVEFLPPRPDPFPYYRSLDVYINTSLHEGLPMSIVEAMACGTPVVSAAVGGIPEIVSHGEHGFLVSGRDPAPFVESCLRLMRDETLRRQMGERASAVAHACWSAATMADGYRRLYADCASRIRDEQRPAPLRGRLVRGLKSQGRRLVMSLDRRRAMTLRRDPAPLVRALREARSILVLCQGNVIRSALAGRLLSAAVEARGDVWIRSAGLDTETGWRAHRRVIARGEALNLDLTGHRAAPVTPALVAAADVVLVMDVLQLVTVTRRFFRARRRTFLLTCLAPDVPMEIPDPAGSDDATVDACLDHVERALKPIIGVMTERDTGTARS